MHLINKKNFIIGSLLFIQSLISITQAFAAPKNPEATAESCRQIALKLDWLSRYQDRPSCTKNLDGLQAYVASQYILNKRFNDAEMILRNLVYQINFAIDTNCYGQDDMKALVVAINKLVEVL